MPTPSQRKNRSKKKPPGGRKRSPGNSAGKKRAPTKRRRPTSRRTSSSTPARKVAPHPDGERLQKVLAAAGIGSRRECEELITSGRVEVDRKMVTELGTRVDPSTQQIRVDGTSLPKVRLVHYAVNKPTGVVSTNSDPSRRLRVIDLVPKTNARLFTVGRLDMSSEGLIIVTNDGELANRLTHPRYGIEKIYRVQVAGRPERKILAQLRRGVRIAEAVCRIENIKVKSHHKESTNLEMVLQEGRNREIRRVLAKMGHKVLHLTRVAVGPVRLGKLPPGESRPLSRQELKALRDAVGSERHEGRTRK